MERTEICKNCLHKAVCKMYEPWEEDSCCAHFKMDTKEFVLQQNREGFWEKKRDPYGVVECVTEADWKGLMDLIEGHGWKKAGADHLPEEGAHVLVLVNGQHGQIRFVNAMLLAYWYEDEGWIIEGYERAYGLKVDWWAETPGLPMEVE